LLGIFAGACTSASSPDAAPGDTNALTKAKTDRAADVAAIGRTLSGEAGPYENKVYWLSGTDPAGTACSVVLSRNDAAYVLASVGTVGANPQGLSFDLYTAAPPAPQTVKLDQTPALFKVGVVETNVNGGRSASNLEARFAADGSLISLRAFADNQAKPNTTPAHVESTCSALKSVLTVDMAAENAPLSSAVRAFYNAKNATKLREPVALATCEPGNVANTVSCVFQSGTWDESNDAPPDEVSATFALVDKKIGALLSATLE
jgi:hypothetical protein